MFHPLIPVCIAISASPVLADWAYTYWGMSPNQVVAASNGAFALRDPKSSNNGYVNRFGERGEAIGKYIKGEFIFHAYTYFSAEKLKRVVLLLDINPQLCSTLEDEVRKNYGLPTKILQQNDHIYYEWYDHQQHSDVSFTSGVCILTYAEPGRPMPQ